MNRSRKKFIVRMQMAGFEWRDGKFWLHGIPFDYEEVNACYRAGIQPWDIKFAIRKRILEIRTEEQLNKRDKVEREAGFVRGNKKEAAKWITPVKDARPPDAC